MRDKTEHVIKSSMRQCGELGDDEVFQSFTNLYKPSLETAKLFK